VGEGSSKGNSAIVHTGFDATPEAWSRSWLPKLSRQWAVLGRSSRSPYTSCGAVLLAIDDEQEAQLPNIYMKALANGVDDVRLLVLSEVRELEPKRS